VYFLARPVYRGHGQKRLKAAGETLPMDDHTAILLLQPSKRPLGLETRHLDLAGAVARFLGVPDVFRELAPDASFA